MIKSYKATNAEFLILKEILGLCSYEVICNEQDFTLISEIQDGELIEESDEELIETKSPLKNEKKDWYDKNKFKKISTIVNGNKFNYKNKIGKFKYDDIKDLVNDIKNNKISETLAKQHLNALNKIKRKK